jgi:hypothetical protein
LARRDTPMKYDKIDYFKLSGLVGERHKVGDFFAAAIEL